MCPLDNAGQVKAFVECLLLHSRSQSINFHSLGFYCQKDAASQLSISEQMRTLGLSIIYFETHFWVALHYDEWKVLTLGVLRLHQYRTNTVSVD